jgi:hypothetical protein
MVDETPYWQVFWLALAEPFPSLFSDSGVCISNRVCGCLKFFKTSYTHRAYSYGDSAGLAPDFPF